MVQVTMFVSYMRFLLLFGKLSRNKVS